jgi:hypothetical protein
MPSARQGVARMILSPEFLDGVLSLCAQLSGPTPANPCHFLTCAAWESGLNPQAINKSSNAAGLIQWMPATLKGFGLTTHDVLAMSGEQQLNLCRRYFAPHKGKLSTVASWYLAIFAQLSYRIPTTLTSLSTPKTACDQVGGPKTRGWIITRMGS